MAQTTVILGAGASADFGLPLGGALFEDAQRALSLFQREYEAANSRHHFFDASMVRSWAQRSEFYNLLVKASANENGVDLGPIFRLVDAMDHAPAYTIDTFALEQPERAEICRIITSHIIIEQIKKLIDQTNFATPIWKFCSRDIRWHSSHDPKQNWMILFVATMRALLRNDSSHLFRFVSFNYDKIAEYGMRRIWNTASSALGQFEDVAEFTYPHGSIDWSVGPHDQSAFSIERSNIVFAHNKRSQESFETAIGWLKKSTFVISLGFNFSPENVSSLKLGESTAGSELVYQNYDKNPGLDRRISGSKLAQYRSFAGPIADAILRGELGELPT